MSTVRPAKVNNTRKIDADQGYKTKSNSLFTLFDIISSSPFRFDV